jgi:hypothetical protein
MAVKNFRPILLKTRVSDMVITARTLERAPAGMLMHDQCEHLDGLLAPNESN